MSRRLLCALLVLASCKRDAPAPGQPAAASSATPSGSALEQVQQVKQAQQTQKAQTPPPAVKPPANRPTLEAKVGVDGEARRAAAAAKIDKVYASIEELANAMPAGCNGSDPGCRKRFEVFGLELAKLRAATALTEVPRCPKSSADDLAVAQMTKAQVAWLSSWIDEVEKVGRGGLVDPGSVWDELGKAADKAHPRIAPSCAN